MKVTLFVLVFLSSLTAEAFEHGHDVRKLPNDTALYTFFLGFSPDFPPDNNRFDFVWEMAFLLQSVARAPKSSRQSKRGSYSDKTKDSKGNKRN